MKNYKVLKATALILLGIFIVFMVLLLQKHIDADTPETTTIESTTQAQTEKTTKKKSKEKESTTVKETKKVKETTTEETTVEETTVEETTTEYIEPETEYVEPVYYSQITPENGLNWYQDHYEVYYSENVLPGEGLDIPGRYTDENGIVRDGDGYVVLATDWSYLPYGSIVDTSWGLGKVYDTGTDYGYVELYVSW